MILAQRCAESVMAHESEASRMRSSLARSRARVSILSARALAVSEACGQMPAGR